MRHTGIKRFGVRGEPISIFCALLAQLIKKRSQSMPGRKHLRGVGPKEQREYEHIKKSAEKSGRYGDRAAEVAARTVMKQHKEKGHSKGR
jgi:hypothetical protein